MHDVPPEAIDILLEARRPDGWLDRALLAYPDAYGDELAAVLNPTRACVMRDGDDRSKAALEPDRSSVAREREIHRVRRILAGRPGFQERTTPAFVRAGPGGILIALAQPGPQFGSTLAVRIQLELHAETVHARAVRVERDAAAASHAVWRCDVPSWIEGPHRMAIELAPNPTGFNEAMLIAQRGAARVLVTAPCDARERASHEPTAASVMPSGWSYLRADRTMGSSLPYFPNGAPFTATHARVPDEDLFALCAARSWTGSLRDSLWLRDRPDYRIVS